MQSVSYKKNLINMSACIKTGMKNILFFTLISNLILLIFPIYSFQVFNRVLTSKSEETLISLSIIAFSLLIIYGLIEFCRHKIANYIINDISSTLSDAISNEKLSESFATKNSSKLESLVTTIYKGIYPSALHIAELLWSPIFLIFLWLLHPTYALIALSMIIIFVSLSLINHYKNKDDKDQPKKMIFNGLEDSIKCTNTSSFLAEESIRIEEKYQTERASQVDFIILVSTLSKTIRLIGQISIIGVGAFLYIENQISIGTMIAGTLIFSRSLQPFESMVLNGRSWIIFYKSLKELQSRLQHTYRDFPRTTLSNMSGQIRIHNALIFHRHTKNIFFKKLSLSIDAGETIATLGGSGSGKSTLLRTIAGLQEVEIGNITIDGAMLEQWGNNLYNYLGYYSPDQTFIPGTIKQNISRYKESDDSVVSACKVIGVHQSIISLPNGYDTNTDDLKSQLSSSEYQRLLIARAIILDPQVLILDDADSFQGPDGEMYLKKIILKRKESGKTTIISSKKPSLINLCNRVIILGKGTIEKILSPEQLAQIGKNKLEISNETK
ncbi:ATP-binding cassette domain-containing protein [Amphritea sp. 2_MG-2023]|uniref:ATP-binding cassette domain-containing protein n=1 Tax=Amphritea TaxID=515417 RepID=UPI001C06B81C|nr:ATP-binding cassette domain-containing protein [Amphritea sp. 2_MG-2023]MBU2964347.1 ATP-binding cassette domain-containing protein [Amphritea atlantica]MDO6419693.1 ATP-binding cassette domain-containing protein [Amphritea sp. 2_MG-2023]